MAEVFNINDLTFTSLETISAFHPTDGTFLFELDELQNATVSQTQDKVDVTGKQGRKLNSFKRNKAVNISGTNGMISGGLMALQTGGEFENKETLFRWREYIVVNGGEAVLRYPAFGTAGAEIDAVYVRKTDGTVGDTLTQDATAAEGKFAYDPASRKLTFDAATVPDGTEVVIYYDRKVKGAVLDNYSDKYSGKATLYIDAMAEDKCSNVYYVQFYIPRGDFNAEFSIELGGDQVVHSFEVESLAGNGCGIAGSKGLLWTYTVIGEKAADIT